MHIVEATKAMIHDQRLLMTLLEEAIGTTIDVQNITPHQTLRENTTKRSSLVQNWRYVI